MMSGARSTSLRKLIRAGLGWLRGGWGPGFRLSRRLPLGGVGPTREGIRGCTLRLAIRLVSIQDVSYERRRRSSNELVSSHVAGPAPRTSALDRRALCDRGGRTASHGG